jgi:hypothetical protein
MVVRILCPPSLALPVGLTLNEGDRRVILATASEPNGLPVTFTVDPQPSWLAVEDAGPTATALVLTPGPGDAGQVDVTVTATSPGGASQATTRITVRSRPPDPNRPPQLGPVPPTAVPPGGPEPTPTPIPIPYDDPDGPPGPPVIEIPVPPTKGIPDPDPERPGGPVVDYTPLPGACGTDAFVVRGIDPAGAIAEVPVVVRILCPPVIDVAPSVTLRTGETRVLLAAALDPNDLPTSLEVESGPAFVGTVTLGAARGARLALVVRPGADDVGDHDVVLRATSPGGDAQAVVRVTVLERTGPNEPPTVGPVPPVETPQNDPVPIPVPVSDPDGPPGRPVTEIPEGPTHANPTVDPTPPGGPVITYTPLPQACGPDAFVVRVTDGLGATADALVQVAVTCPPRLDLPATVSVVEGETAGVTARAVDANGRPTTLAAGPRPGWVAFTDLGDGTGELSLAPPLGSAGTYEVDVTATSTGSTTRRITVRVLPPNQPPALGPVGPVDVPAGEPVPIPIPWSDPDGPPTPPVFRIPDPPMHGRPTIEPGPVVVITPDPGYCGPDRFTIEATDGAGATSQLLVELRVTCPPSLDLPARVRVVEGTTAQVTASAADPNGASVVLGLGPVPGWVTGASPAPGLLTITAAPPAGTAGTTVPVLVTATSPGGTRTGIVEITVVLPNQPPVLGPLPPVDTPQDVPVELPIPWNDPDGPPGEPEVEVVEPPAHGTPTVLPGPGIRYEPAAGWCGPDRFLLRAVDALGAESLLEVRVRVTCPPTLTLASPVTLTEGETAVVVASATDANDLPITFTTGPRPDWTGLLPQPGGVAVLVLQPDFDDAGDLTIDVTATSAGGSTTVPVAVEVLDGDPAGNRPPVVGPIPEVTIPGTPPGEAPVPVTVPIPWSDPDGPPPPPAPPAEPTITVPHPPPPTVGVPTVVPGPQISFTPASGFCGTAAFAVRAVDAAGGRTDAPVVVRVTCPPVLDLPPPVTLRGGEVQVVEASAVDRSGLPVTISGGARPSWVQVVPRGPGRVALVVSPPSDVRGSFTAALAATSGGGTTTGTLSIQVLPALTRNDPPVLQPVPTVITQTEVPVTFEIPWADPDGPMGSPTFTVSDPTNGEATVTPTGSVTYTPGAGWCGPDEVEVQAVDAAAGRAVLLVPVQVWCAPSLDLPATVSLYEGEQRVVLATYADRNHLPVTLTPAPLPGFAAVSSPVAGLAAITLAPGPGSAGPHAVTLTVSSAGGDTTSSMLVTVLSAPMDLPPELGPVPVVHTPQDTPVTVPIPWIDPDGPQAEPELEISEPPDHGSATVLPGPAVQYLPAPGWCGPDRVTVTNAGGAGTPLTIDVRVLCPPDLDAPTTVTLQEGETRVVVVTAVDANGLPVTLAGGERPAWAGFLPIGSGVAVVVLQPGFGDAGSATVAVSATSAGGSAETTIAVEVLEGTPGPNQPPVVGPIPVVDTPAGVPVTIPVPWTDPDGPPLPPDPPVPPSFTVDPPPNEGTAVIVPGPAVEYTPAAGACGPVAFGVRATDAGAAIGQALVAVRVTCPPVLDVPARVVMRAGTQRTATVRAVDRNGFPVTLELDAPPAWTALAATGPGRASLLLQPGLADEGTRIVQVRATSAGGSAVGAVVVVVLPPDGTNEPPRLGPLATIDTPAGTPVTFTVPWVDPDGPASPPPTFSVPEVPERGTATAGPGPTVTYTPFAGVCGPDSVPVAALDAAGARSELVVPVRVLCPPEIDLPSVVTLFEGETRVVLVTAADTNALPVTLASDALPPVAAFEPLGPGLAAVVLTPDGGTAGTYEVPVTASSLGGSTTKVLVVTVLDDPMNQPPAIGPVGTLRVPQGETRTVTVPVVDPDGPDGIPPVLTLAAPNPHVTIGSGPSVTYTAPAAACGPDAVVLQATDALGATGQALLAVAVTCDPVLVAPDAVSVPEGGTAVVIVQAVDPNGGPVAVSAAPLPDWAAPVPFGPGQLAIVLTPGPGTAGTTVATLEAESPDGRTTRPLTITVVGPTPNVPPSVGPVPPLRVRPGETATVPIPWTDPDGPGAEPVFTVAPPGPSKGSAGIEPGPVLTYTAGSGPCGPDPFVVLGLDAAGNTGAVLVPTSVDCPPILEIQPTVEVAEATVATVPVAAGDPDGTPVTLDAVGTWPPFASIDDAGDGTGTLRLEPGFDDAGTVSLTVRASSDGLSTTRTIVVTVVETNQPPVAPSQQAASTPAGVPVDITVLATDPDGDPLTASVTTPPTSGTATGLGGLTVRYSPAPGYCGPDSLVVTVDDGRGGTGTTAITVAVTCPPTLVLDPVVLTVPEGTVAAATVTATDANDQPIVLSTGPLPGFVEFRDEGDGTGTLTASPSFDDAGELTIEVTATSGGGSRTDTVFVVVLDVNRPPTVEPATAATRDATPVVVPLVVGDPDGDSPLALSISGPPLRGTAETAGPAAVLYTPAAEACAFGDLVTDTFVVTVTDPDLLSGSALVTVTIDCTAGPEAPTADAGADLDADEGDTVTLTGTATGGTPVWSVALAGPDGLPLAGGLGVCTASPDMLGLTVTCVDDAVLLATLTVTGPGGVATDTATVRFANVAPGITRFDGPRSGIAGQPVTLEVAFTDPGLADTHTWTIAWSGIGTAGSSGGTVTPGARDAQPAVSLEPGLYRLTLTVADDDGGTDTAEWTDVLVTTVEGVRLTGGGNLDTAAGRITFAVNVRGEEGAASGNVVIQDHGTRARWKLDQVTGVARSGDTVVVRGSAPVDGSRHVVTLVAVVGRPDQVRIRILDGDRVVLDTAPGAPPPPALDGMLALHGGNLTLHAR